MSLSSQSLATARHSARAGWETSLRLVGPVRRRARKAPFVVVVLGILAVGLVGLIVMSTLLQKQSFAISELRKETRLLEIERQALDRDVSQLQSPAELARRAMAQGMVPNSSPVFLRLSDGKIIGTPMPAEAGTNIGQGD